VYHYCVSTNLWCRMCACVTSVCRRLYGALATHTHVLSLASSWEGGSGGKVCACMELTICRKLYRVCVCIFMCVCVGERNCGRASVGGHDRRFCHSIFM